MPASIETTADIGAYAVSACSACATKVFVIGQHLKAARKVRVHIAGKVNAASLLFLEGPSLTSFASEVKYGGVQFGADGHTLAPNSTKPPPDAGGDYVIFLPSASAASLTLAP